MFYKERNELRPVEFCARSNGSNTSTTDFNVVDVGVVVVLG